MSIAALLTEVGNAGSVTTLSAPGKAIGAVSINVGSTSNWPSPGKTVFFALRTTSTTNITASNTSGVVPGTYSEWKGIVGTNTLTNLVLQYGNDQVYTPGTNTQVLIPVTAPRENALVAWGNAHADEVGNLLPAAVTAALGTGNLANTGFNALGFTPNTVTYNGNRSYDLTFNGTDLTGVLSEGMRLRTTRTVLPQTQVTNLNGTTHFWSRVAPAGMTFTTAFTLSVLIKLASYGGAIQTIISRGIASGGFELRLETSGQLSIIGYTASAFRGQTTFQSVPLNKWTHVVMTQDMPTGNVTAYIDGVSVPTGSLAGSTAITAIVNTGDLYVGSLGASRFFPGKIAQAAVSSSILTATQAKSICSQGITPADVTALNIISAYSFNGNANDLNSTNASNLTANAGVTATSADSPFSTGTGTNLTSGFDYAIVMSKPVFATNTTVTVSVPEGCAIPTSGGVSAVVYSSQDTPFGFVRNKDRWTVASKYLVNEPVAIGAINTWFAANARLVTPIGSWTLSYQGSALFASNISGIRNGHITLADTAPANGIRTQDLTSPLYSEIAQTNVFESISKAIGYTTATQSTNVIYGQVSSATGTETYQIRGNDGAFIIQAENAFL